MAVNRYYSSIAVDTTLTTGISSSDTQIVLASTQGYPTSYPFTLALDYDTSAEELVNVVGVGAVSNSYIVGTSVGTASVTGRGVDSTTAQSHSASAAVKHVISGRDMREAQEHIAASTNVHGITDTANLATKTGTETLTNKTLTAPAISGGTIASTAITAGSITGSVGGNPTFTGTVTLPSTTSIGSVSATEIGYVDGVTSAIQTQLDAKAPLASPTFTGTVTLPTGVTGATGAITANMMASGSVTSTAIADGTIVNADINASAAIAWSKIEADSTNNYKNPIGSMTMWAGDTASPPSGWLTCDGSAVSRTTYASLFTVIGTTYGAGDNTSTFNLPDLRSRSPLGAGTGTGLSARTLGVAGGAESHNHDLSSNGYAKVTITAVTPPNLFVERNTVSSWTATHSGSAGSSVGNSSTSSTTATNLGGTTDTESTQSPYLPVNFIIKY